jgi:hypothetical protein
MPDSEVMMGYQCLFIDSFTARYLGKIGCLGFHLGFRDQYSEYLMLQRARSDYLAQIKHYYLALSLPHLANSTSDYPYQMEESMYQILDSYPAASTNLGLCYSWQELQPLDP